MTRQQVEYINGEVFDFSQYVSPDYRVIHRDRNGNEITYHFAKDSVTQRVRPVKITDTLGREVFLRYDGSPDPRSISSIAVKNHAGVEKSWTFSYTNAYHVDPHAHLGAYYNCQHSGVHPWPWALQAMTLPNGTAYQFTYNIDHLIDYLWWDGSQWVTIYMDLSTLQMTSMTAPTGAVTTFQYEYPGRVPDEEEEYNQRLNHVLRSITVDPVGGGAFTTTYEYTYLEHHHVRETGEAGDDRVLPGRPVRPGRVKGRPCPGGEPL